MVKSDQIHAAACLHPRTPVRIGGWMGSREGMDLLEKGKISYSYRESKEFSSVNQLVVISDPM